MARVLLELVDDEQAFGGVQAFERVLARCDEGGDRGARQAPALGGGQQPGPQQRGLPDAGRAEDGEEPAVLEPGDQLVQQLLAAEEPLGVLGLVGGQPSVGRLGIELLAVGRLRQLRADLAPAHGPRVAVAVAGVHEGQGDVEAGQPLPTCRIRYRRQRKAGALRQLPIGGPAGRCPQLPQVQREPLHGAGVGVDLSQWSWHWFSSDQRHCWKKSA
jgi:hypothetical protein